MCSSDLKDGSLLVELGHRQGARVLERASASGWSASLYRDLGGVERVFEARRA